MTKTYLSNVAECSKTLWPSWLIISTQIHYSLEIYDPKDLQKVSESTAPCCAQDMLLILSTYTSYLGAPLLVVPKIC